MNPLSLFALLFLLMMPFQASSQQKVVDILEAKLDTMQEGFLKADAYIALIRAYSYMGDSPQKYKVLEKAEDLSNKLGYQKGIALTYIFRSIEQWNSGHFDESRQTLLKADDIAQTLGDQDLQVMVDYNMAEIYIYMDRDFPKGIKKLQSTIQKNEKGAGVKNLGNAYRILGEVFMEIGDSIKAYEAGNKALDLFLSIKEGVEIDPELGKVSDQYVDEGSMNTAQAYRLLGDICQKYSNLEGALELYLEAEKIFEEWDTPYFAGHIQTSIGELQGQSGNYTEALRFYVEAKANYERANNPYWVAISDEGISKVFHSLGDYDEAEKYGIAALTHFIELEDSIGMGDAYSTLSQIAFAKEDLNQAEKMGRAGLEIRKLINDSTSIAASSMDLGNILRRKDTYEEAYLMYKKALEFFQLFDQKVHTTKAQMNLAYLFFDWQKIDSAIFYVNSFLSEERNNSQWQTKKDGLLLLSRIHAQAGDFEKAYENRLAFFDEYEKIYTKDVQEIAKTEQTRQNVALYQKEKETAQANAKLLAERNRLYILLGSILGILLLLTVILFLRLRSSAQALEVQKAKLEALNLTKDKFFSIIAHDIRSPMLALQSVGKQMEFNLKKGRMDKLADLSQMVAQTTSKLDDLLNNLLNWALSQRGLMPYRPKMLSLQKLVNETSQLYAGAMEAKQLDFSHVIPDEHKVKADEGALHGTLRNLLSNAIKFTPVGGKISISSQQKQGVVEIEVSDNGIGIKQENLDRIFSLEGESEKGTEGEKGTGLGLVLCKELVALNKGELQVKSKVGDGTTFTFSIPVN